MIEKLRLTSLFGNLFALRSDEVDPIVKRGNDAEVHLYDKNNNHQYGGKMTMSNNLLINGKIEKMTKFFKSKQVGGEDYYLYYYVWSPDGSPKKVEEVKEVPEKKEENKPQQLGMELK